VKFGKVFFTRYCGLYVIFATIRLHVFKSAIDIKALNIFKLLKI